MKTKAMAIIMATLFLVMAFNIVPALGKLEGKPAWIAKVPRDYGTIQDAVDAYEAWVDGNGAGRGIIIVEGIYSDPAIIISYDDLTLQADGAILTNTLGPPVIVVNGADNIVIKGFTIESQRYWPGTYGIVLRAGSTNCVIKGNTITGRLDLHPRYRFDVAIDLTGHSEHNDVKGNTIKDNGMGIHMFLSPDNIIRDDNVFIGNWYDVVIYP